LEGTLLYFANGSSKSARAGKHPSRFYSYEVYEGKLNATNANAVKEKIPSAIKCQRGSPRIISIRRGKGYPSATIAGALAILPAEMQRVHTRTRRRVPLSSTIFTVWRFGSQRRRVLLWAWLTLFPVAGPLPHT